MAPIIIKRSPSDCSAPEAEEKSRENTSNAPPEIPRKRPISFKAVKDSFKNQAAKKVIAIGVVKINKEAWIGLVNDMPRIEKVWFMVIPANAQKINKRKSFLAILIFPGLTAYKNQKSIVVTAILMAVNANGESKPGVMCLTAITVVPKKKLPSNTAALAFWFSFMN